MIQKRRRCLFSAHSGTLGLRIASPHRIDNAVSPRQYELYIIKVYRNAPRDASVVICLLWLGICEIRRAQRQTFENVFFIYKTARFTHYGLTSDAANLSIISEKTKKKVKIFRFPPSEYFIERRGHQGQASVSPLLLVRHNEADGTALSFTRLLGLQLC